MMMDPLASSIPFRLKLFGIPPDLQREISEVWKTIHTDTESILLEYYEFACTFDAGKILYSGNEQALSTVAVVHYDKLFSARFDADYLKSARQIGTQLQKMGFDAIWIIATRRFMLEKLSLLIGKRTRWNGTKVARTICLLEKALIFDIDMILTVYQERALDAANERSLRLQEAISQSELGPEICTGR